MILRRLVILILVCRAFAADGQSVVTLKPSARIAEGQALTLASIAAVRGDARLAGIPISPAVTAAGRYSFGVDDVRDAIERAGIPRNTVVVRGSRCEVVVRRSGPARPDRDSPPPSEPIAAPEDGTHATIEDHVRHHLLERLGLPAERLELRFDDRDARLRAIPTRGWTVEVRLTGISRRTPVRLTMYADDGTVRDETLRVELRVRRDLALAARAVPRGAALTAQDVRSEPRWVAPDSPLLPFDQALGMVVRRSLDPGDELTRGHVESPLAVREGDVVIVHIAHGTVVLRREARALSDGRIGETIGFVPLTAERRGREPAFQATIDRPGRAVIVAGHDRKELSS
ncbi:MAG: flagellar basal body P-ring formation chaperone FlgA [Planctomycetota bacterium]